MSCQWVMRASPSPTTRICVASCKPITSELDSLMVLPIASRRFFQDGTAVLFGLAMLKVANVRVGTGKIVGEIVGSVTLKVGAALIVGAASSLCGIQLEAAGTTISEAITTKTGIANSLLCLKSLNAE